MHLVELVAVVAMLLVAVAVFAFRRRSQVADAPAEEPAYSLVRILTTDEELRDAALRAARFDEIAAASAEARTRRYQLLAGPSPTPLHALPVIGSGDAGDPPSAARGLTQIAARRVDDHSTADQPASRAPRAPRRREEVNDRPDRRRNAPVAVVEDDLGHGCAA